jgi:hypothetical protein
MGKEKRSNIRHFLNSTPDASAATYELLGDGITELTMNYNPNVETEQYIHEDNADIQVTSYAPTIPIEMSVWSGDDAFDYIDSLRQGGPALLADADTDIIEVRLYETPDTPGTSYPATQWPVSVQFDTFGGTGGESGKISFTLNINGDPVEGDFNTTTLAFTADS